MASMGGLLFGALVSVVNGSSVTVLVPVSLVLGVGWSWAALAVGAGALTTRKRLGGVVGAVALVCAVVGYYATDLARGVYRYADQTDPAVERTLTDWSGLESDLARWSIIALIAGYLLGLAGAGARQQHSIGGLLWRLVVPAIAALEMLWRLSGYPQPVAIATWATVGILAIVTAVVLIAAHLRTPHFRRYPRQHR